MKKDYYTIASEILDSIQYKEDMKEIDYDKMYKTGNHIILQGKFMGIDILILFYGRSGHPCAYFRIPDENHTLKRLVLYEGYDAVPFQCVNWGFTFGKEITKDDHERLEMGFTPGVRIGWDYGHCGDYAGYYKESYFKEELRKRTTTDILIEVVEQILALKEGGYLYT